MTETGYPKSDDRSQKSDIRTAAPHVFRYLARHLALSRQLPRTADAIAAKYPEGRFDAIFADPPYFLSNGGITCHAGKMVKVDKGDWDVSRGPELNHEFNTEWLRRCQRVLKPNGTIWVTGTHHVIFSIGYAHATARVQDSERHRLGKAQSTPEPELPLFHPFDRDRPLGREKREKANTSSIIRKCGR